MAASCEVCFRHCALEEGQTGFCGGRTCAGGRVVASNYGKVTSMMLDPIEKKPLRRFRPGNKVLSVGSYGCNLRCPFCQNHEISWSAEALRFASRASFVSPEKLVGIAQELTARGNIGIAFTYNEPLIGYEYVRDTAKLAHERGLAGVLVTNGTAERAVLEELLPYIDAMNIDLKGFREAYYRDVLGGSLQMVLEFIERAVRDCHVEITTLVVPGENDTEEEIRAISRWIAGLTDAAGNRIGREVPLHLSRFFPQFHMRDRDATDVAQIYRLAEVAREALTYVYTGNC
ncbi:MAG: AmmeMemoRadiSam system radical SAM enzyme [Mogibacterium sp.]|nr:AmmeMemoRadiSam system radical SAM enzyme [Mogibacterium sp.]